MKDQPRFLGRPVVSRSQGERILKVGSAHLVLRWSWLDRVVRYTLLADAGAALVRINLTRNQARQLLQGGVPEARPRWRGHRARRSKR